MIGRSLGVWVILILAEILHGAARAILLVPRVGDLRARQIGVFTGSAIILPIAVACIRWTGARTTGRLLATGAIWLILTLAFEFLFGRFVAGYSWQRLLADYDPAQGGFLALGMAVLFFSPWMAARIRGIRD
jgi:hypothetical protein